MISAPLIVLFLLIGYVVVTDYIRNYSNKGWKVHYIDVVKPLSDDRKADLSELDFYLYWYVKSGHVKIKARDGAILIERMDKDE